MNFLGGFPGQHWEQKNIQHLWIMKHDDIVSSKIYIGKTREFTCENKEQRLVSGETMSKMGTSKNLTRFRLKKRQVFQKCTGWFFWKSPTAKKFKRKHLWKWRGSLWPAENFSEKKSHSAEKNRTSFLQFLKISHQFHMTKNDERGHPLGSEEGVPHRKSQKDYMSKKIQKLLENFFDFSKLLRQMALFRKKYIFSIPCMLAKHFVSAKNQRGTSIEKLRKSSTVQKNPKVLWSPLYFCRHKNFSLVRESNPDTPTSRTSENSG